MLASVVVEGEGVGCALCWGRKGAETGRRFAVIPPTTVVAVELGDVTGDPDAGAPTALLRLVGRRGTTVPEVSVDVVAAESAATSSNLN